MSLTEMVLGLRDVLLDSPYILLCALTSLHLL